MPNEGGSRCLSGIEIFRYDATWPSHFAREATCLRLWTKDLLSNVEHVGSTAVPGLVAKNVIDIMVSLPDLRDLDQAIPLLDRAGYQEVAGVFSYRRFLQKAASASRPAFNLHVVTDSAWPNKSERLFRDWLISRPDVSARYGDLKRALARQSPEDLQAYTMGKNAFIRASVNDARRSCGLAALTEWEE